MNKAKISYTMNGDTLLIYADNNILAEISDGKETEEFVDEILCGMGYFWNADGSIEMDG